MTINLGILRNFFSIKKKFVLLVNNMNCFKTCLNNDIVNDDELKQTIIDFLEILARHTDHDIDDEVINYVKLKLQKLK